MTIRNHLRRHAFALALAVSIASATDVTAQTPMPGGPQPGVGPVTADERREVVESIRKLLEERYVFPDVGIKSGAHIVQELERGAYDALSDPREFAEALTASLQSVNHDKHMRVMAKPAEVATVDRVDPIAQHLRQQQGMRAGNFGFHALERHDGNVGYLDLRGFAPLQLGRETAIAAMRFLAGSDAIVIDLRRNGGGNPDMVRFLCSYFFDRPTHINSLYWREGDRTEDFHTSPDVPGEHMGDVPVFIVTSNKTFSAAEEFSYNLQTQKRATLVGEVTGGGANPGGVYPANERFGIFVPTGRAVNPVTKVNWEGVGVVPEIRVSIDKALDSALALARVAARERREEIDATQRANREKLATELRHASALFAENRKSEAVAAVNAALAAARDRNLIEEGLINWLGYDYMGRKELSMAIAVFEYNTRAYPTSGNTYDSLGEAYMNAGDTKSAIANYRRALELDPDNGNATAMIEKMAKHAGHDH